jgi:hypothetical protein
VYPSLLETSVVLIPDPLSAIKDIHPALCECFSISPADLVLVLRGGCVGNTQSLSSLNLSGSEQITVLDRTTTADAVALSTTTPPFFRHEGLSRVAAINGIQCLCPSLAHAKVGLRLENCNNGIGTVIDAIHRTGSPRPMRRLADPYLPRFAWRMCGSDEEAKLKSKAGMTRKGNRCGTPKQST